MMEQVVINKDSELLEKQYRDMQYEMDDPMEMVAGRDLPGMETYEQNDAALNTFLMDQRQSLRNYDVPQDADVDDRAYSLMRKSSFMPAIAEEAGEENGQAPQMDDLIAQNFAKLMRANEEKGQTAIRRVTTDGAAEAGRDRKMTDFGAARTNLRTVASAFD
jgi:citrate synthase